MPYRARRFSCRVLCGDPRGSAELFLHREQKQPAFHTRCFHSLALQCLFRFGINYILIHFLNSVRGYTELYILAGVFTSYGVGTAQPQRVVRIGSGAKAPLRGYDPKAPQNL